MIRFIFILLIMVSNLEAFAEDNSETYPGKEVEVKDGKFVKRWSTKGPVSVSQAPQPFQDTSKQNLPNGILLNIDPTNSSIRSSTVTNNKGEADRHIQIHSK